MCAHMHTITASFLHRSRCARLHTIIRVRMHSFTTTHHAGSYENYSTVVFWVARVKPSPCHNHRLLGEQRGEEIFRPLPEFEALVGIQDQPLNECLRLLTTRFPNGFDGYAPFCR